MVGVRRLLTALLSHTVQGGAKMARGLMDAVLGVNSEFWGASNLSADVLHVDSLVDGGRSGSNSPASQQMPRQ